MLTNNYLKIAEVSRKLKISRYYVNRLIGSGVLKVVIIGGVRFVTSESVQVLVDQPSERSDLNVPNT